MPSVESLGVGVLRDDDGAVAVAVTEEVVDVSIEVFKVCSVMTKRISRGCWESVSV